MENRFFNRELSWLEFNARVLYQGLRKELPLLERLQFLSIVTSNFDEFFQVRVASVKRALYENPDLADVSGLTPALQLTSISARAHQIIRDQQNCLMNDVLPSLAKTAGIVYVKPENYTVQQSAYINKVFKSDIYPLLTPLRTDTEPFPHIKNLSVYAAYSLSPISGIKMEKGSEALKGSDELPRIAFVEVPDGIPYIYWLPSENKSERPFAILDDIIANFGTSLFPGLEVNQSMLFKLARDADFAVDEDAGNNFIHAMEDVLIQRKSSFPVQLSCNGSSREILEFLKEKLELGNEDIYLIDGILNPAGLMELRSTDEEGKMSFEKWEHFYPCDLPEDEPYWDSLKRHDKILHVPYECYDPVVKMISDAADDENVLAIKMTLYRTGGDSPIIKALEAAAARGKQVVVLVELKARFDEERNIAWANELEQAGVTVIYGLVNLKVHAKILMVVRREADTIRRYVHLATGNYNPKTAKLYSDISLFTANQEIASDATNFFNLVTGYSTLQKMNLLGMAPVTIKSRLLSMIQREIDRSTPDNPGLIMAKMNSLTHEEVIEALYKASQAGVKVMLNIRGICMLVPGVKGMSENITVTSIVDRYLEHARIFYFQNGGTPELYCSSADWMSRNLDRRIELMFPILDKEAFKEVKMILDTYFEDNTNAQALQSNGSWLPVEKENADFQAQAELYKIYKKRAAKTAQKEQTEFIVRRK
ncbi:MAG: polyphosphate kinase 1 [Treponema sp.]|nr:polyphosphate kinase 1 [Treponema sp.]